MITSSVNERDERKQTFRSSIVNFENDIITGACTSFREKHRGNLLTVCGVRCIGGVTLIRAFVRNLRI